MVPVLQLPAGLVLWRVRPAPISVPGDLHKVVGDLCVQVQPPVDDGALMFGGQPSVGAGEVLDHGVDSAFQRVRR